MPQKKNAVSAELVRAKAGSVMGGLVAACTILKALPYSYNLDLQEVTPQVWRAFDDTIESLAVLSGTVATLSVKGEALRRSIDNDNSTAVALANHLVKQHGISFRQAHAIVGQLVRISAETGKPLHEVASARIAGVSSKFGKRITVDHETAKKVLSPERFLGSIATEGGSNPLLISGATKARKKELERTVSALSEMKASLRSSERKLKATASGIAREVKS